jgi:hypothetical protein
MFPAASEPASQSAAAADHRAAPAREPGFAPGGWAAGLPRDEGITLTTEMVLQLDREQPPDDASTASRVTAEWALWGKEANETAYRVLRCSDGTFGADDFREIITRYASGVKEELPQYTVCWIPSGQGHPAYLAVAIHELADPDPRRSGERSRTAGGRQIEFVRLFCVRYAEMEGLGVSYTDLIESVKDYQLLPGETAPIDVTLRSETAPPRVAPSRLMLENVVARLLTTRPVCVLEAEGTTAEERLLFIEQVMSLLPYGLRIRLSASTWASSTAQDLKLRLFFANARRDDGSKTSYVTWGVPKQLNLSAPEYDAVRLYLSWLSQAGSGAAPALAEVTKPLRFTEADIRGMVATLPRDRSVTETLEVLADSLRKDDMAGIRGAVDRLKRHLASQERLADREAYRQVIFKLGLLKDRLGLNPSTRASVYRVLLKLAFDTPLTYASYCEIEHAIGGRPGGALRSVLLKEFIFSSFIPFILVAKAQPGFRDQELVVLLFKQGQGIQPTVPVDEVAGLAGSIRPKHRVTVYEFAVRYLRHTSEDSWRELRRRGYLAETLEALFPGNIKEQRPYLQETLRLGYGERLSPDQIRDLFDHSGPHPTAALEDVARSMAASPKAVKLIAQQAAFARLSSAGYAEDALILTRGRVQRSRPPIRQTVRLIPRATIYTMLVFLLILAFFVFLLLTAAHV